MTVPFASSAVASYRADGRGGSRGNRRTNTLGSAVTTYVASPNASVASATTGSTVVSYAYDDAGRRVVISMEPYASTAERFAIEARANGSSLISSVGTSESQCQ